jgi:hypothetical protein
LLGDLVVNHGIHLDQGGTKQSEVSRLNCGDDRRLRKVVLYVKCTPQGQGRRVTKLQQNIFDF